MALTVEDKSDKPDNGEIANCKSKQEIKKENIRRKYSSKKNDLQVRRRAIEKNTIVKKIRNTVQYNFAPVTSVSSTMFYPPAPCPHYYPVINDLNTDTGIPVQCPMYSLQTVPIIVNPLSSQIYPYPPIVTQTIPHVAFSPIVPVANEFSLQNSNEVSPIGTPGSSELSPVYSEISPFISSNGFVQSNGVSLCGMPVSNFSSYAPLSNDTTVGPSLTNQISFSSYELSPTCTTMLSPIQVPNEFIPIVTPVCDENCSFESFACYELELPKHTLYEDFSHKAKFDYEYVANPLEFYFSLPKDLFPTARMMTIDPNSMIDEFCRVPSVDDYAWILDLEFGVPKTPVTRRVATYNVKFNSIHCKNTPEAIHPGFESCDKDLKRALMFYYDCVISNWYRGYVAMSGDRSVENFQSWLRLPMEVLGMCWP